LGNLMNDKVSQPNADLQRHAKQLEKPNPVVVFFAIGPLLSCTSGHRAC